MHTVEKTFEFDLAHRIHNQNLDSSFTETDKPVLKCRRLHGHTAQLKIKLGSDKLVDDMVIDYNEMGFVKRMVDDVLDHRTLLSSEDPLYEKVVKNIFKQYTNLISGISLNEFKWHVRTIDTSSIEDQDIKEFLSAFVIVPFTTSSENIANWIAEVVKEHVDLYNTRNNTDVKLISVSYKETPKSEAVYTV